MTLDDLVKDAKKEICEILKETPQLSFLKKKKLQMKLAWKIAKRAEEENILVPNLGPLISEMWQAVEEPVCPVPESKRVE
jgi:hypothetical protein